MKTYRIANWSERYENNRTRDLKRLEWFPMPNRMDGDGYTELLDHKDGPLDSTHVPEGYSAAVKNGKVKVWRIKE